MSDKLIRLTPNSNNQPQKQNETKSKPEEAHKSKKNTQVDDFIQDAKSDQDQVRGKKRIITKITAQKAKGRYNIFLDGEYAFPVSENVLIRHVLTKGTHVSKDFQKQLETEDSFSKAYSRALNYLSHSLRTEKQVRDDLFDKDYEAYADQVIEKLKDQRLINDLEYAKSYVRTQANINRKGPKLIDRELQEKGVAELTILDAMVEYPEDYQVDNASELIQKRMKKPNKSSERQKMQKIRQYLFGKGYANDVINQAFDIVESEVDDEEEYQALVKQADKAYRRYARKSSGYELKQKLKAYLFNKGYQSELINRYIDEELEDEF